MSSPRSDRGFRTSSSYELQVLLHIHNHAETIERVIQEIYDAFSPLVPFQFILCEDGSTDDTRAVLRKIAATFPCKLVLSDQHRGYFTSIREGMLTIDAPYLFCLDVDGPCDLKAFQKYWEARHQTDVITGWRVNRTDAGSWLTKDGLRAAMSRAFYQLWRDFFECQLHDPSCPFVLARREVVLAIAPQMGAMPQGYWWEFIARSYRLGFSMREIQVARRTRAPGADHIGLHRLPGIAYTHAVALFQILHETRYGRSTYREDADPWSLPYR